MFVRLGDWLAPRLVRHRFVVLAVWLLMVVFGGLGASHLNQLMTDETGAHASSSWRADEMLRDTFGFNPMTTLAIVYERTAATPESALDAYRAQIDAAVRHDGNVKDLHVLPLPATIADLAVSQLALQPDISDADSTKVVDDVTARIAGVRAPPGVHASLIGRPVVMRDLRLMNDREVGRIEHISLVVSLVVLVFVFGSLVAALLPLLVGVASLFTALGIVGGLYGLLPVVMLTRLVAGIIAIALGIDYALFFVSRYREERSRGENVERALARSIGHTGEAIAFSGLVMMVAVASLAIPDQSAMQAVAGAIVVVVAVSLVASLTLLPALLATLDPILDWPRLFARLRWGHEERYWSAFSAVVLRYYKPILVGATVLVVLLIAQLGHLRIWEPGPTLLPAELPSRQAYDVLARHHLTGELDAFYVVVHQPPGPQVVAPDTLTAMDGLSQALLRDPRIRRIDSLLSVGTLAQARAVAAQLNNPLLAPLVERRLSLALREDPHGTTTIMRVVPRDGMTTPDVCDLVAFVQRTMADTARPPGLTWELGGDMPRRVDFTNEIYGKAPWVVLCVVGGIYLLLFVYFRSYVLPAKAVLMNAIPVLGGCAMLVLVLQDGVGASLLGIQPPGAVMAMTPLMLFSMTFGLSMDYEVLILSRVREAHRRGLDDEAAIVEGMTRTSGVVTGAALIMLSVFAPNLFSELINAKELGIGLSGAIILDATIVRLLLVPTVMRGLGRWNWLGPRSRLAAEPLDSLLDKRAS
ncbi:MAG TPA: MMPL family transporter [Oscillatoriaceae cyanobacterium]